MITSLEELGTILDKVDLGFDGFVIKAGYLDVTGFYIQIQIPAGLFSGCRKWYISSHSTVSEVVQTCLKAVLTALEHEVRERFSYKGVAIFAPHFDVDAIASLNLPHDVRNK